MKDVKFYYCEICGNLTYLLDEGEGEMICCGEPMKLLTAGTTDAATEKHVPYLKRDGNHLEAVIGEVEHPMLEKHYITWIAAVQGDRVIFQHLSPGDEPKACFELQDGPVEVYEFCNLHGLWKADA